MSDKCAELVGRCWDILNSLYNESLYVHQIAQELGKKDSGVSPYLGDLRKEGLIDFNKGIKRRRYYRLTEKGRKIVEAFKGTEKPPERPPLLDEEFEKLLIRFHKPETRDLALIGLEDMVINYNLTSDRPIKEIFELIQSGDNIPNKFYRILTRLSLEGKKAGVLTNELSLEIEQSSLNKILDDSATLNERREALSLWVNLDTKVVSNDMIDYCINTARIEGTQKYKETEDLIHEILRSALQDDDERDNVRQRLWNLVEQENDEEIKIRYETFLKNDIGLYKGALRTRASAPYLVKGYARATGT